VFLNDLWVQTSRTALCESSHWFWQCNRNAGCKFCIMFFPRFWADYYILIYAHLWELMKSMDGQCSSSSIHDEGDDLRLCVSDFLKVMTAVSMTSILISSLASFAPIARKFMCCSCRLSLCVQNWFLCHCKFTFKYAVKWNFCCCFGFCWITDAPCGKMLILYSPKLLDFCRQPKYLEHTQFHWLK
jgi:hypothetical protein